MFETYDFDYLINRMLDKVSDKIDKREGSIVFDALAPAALELSELYVNMDIIINECFADTASYYYLIKRAAERNLFPYEATKTIVRGEFTPDTVEITAGTRFNLGSLNYTVIKRDDDGYMLECETEGIIGNQQLGDIMPLEPLEHLETGKITEILIPGEDEEDMEVFRNRYFSSFQSQSFGGNVADYIKKTNAISGVGGVKVYPVWNGGGTVKLVIINSAFEKPSATLIEAVQTTLDPAPDQGRGVGLAPIGHVVTVAGVTNTAVNISSLITYQTGWAWDDIKPYAEKAIDGYFKELAMTWMTEENLTVRISQIETRMLGITGVVDIANTKINGMEQNLSLDGENIPIRGELHG